MDGCSHHHLQQVSLLSGVLLQQFILDGAGMLWKVWFRPADSISYWQIFHISLAGCHKQKGLFGEKKPMLVILDLAPSSPWSFLITHKMCSTADISWCRLSGSPQKERFSPSPDQNEMNHIFSLFDVTNPAILHMDVTCASSQLSTFHQWQKMFMP